MTTLLVVFLLVALMNVPIANSARKEMRTAKAPEQSINPLQQETYSEVILTRNRRADCRLGTTLDVASGGSASGATAGALTGFSIGSAVPVFGQVLGATIGGFIGFFAGGGVGLGGSNAIAGLAC